MVVVAAAAAVAVVAAVVRFTLLYCRITKHIGRGRKRRQPTGSTTNPTITATTVDVDT